MDFWGPALPRHADAHRVIRAAPLNHVNAFNRQHLFEILDGAFLLNHDDNDDIAECLNVVRTPPVSHIRESAGCDTIAAAIFGCIGARNANAFLHILNVLAIGVKHTLEAGADSALREEAARLLVYFNHRRDVMQFRRPAQIVQIVQVKRAVFPNEFNVVIHPGVADCLHDGGPRRVDVRADGRFIGVQ